MSDMDETRDAIEQLAEEFLRSIGGASILPLPSMRRRTRYGPIVFASCFRPSSCSRESSSIRPGHRNIASPRHIGRKSLSNGWAISGFCANSGGGMGVVYEAIQESLDRHVALKVLPASFSSSPRVLRRFQREAQAAARLHHMNIVSVFGVGQHEGRHFYVMEYIEGCSLDRVLAELARVQSGLLGGLS